MLAALDAWLPFWFHAIGGVRLFVGGALVAAGVSALWFAWSRLRRTPVASLDMKAPVRPLTPVPSAVSLASRRTADLAPAAALLSPDEFDQRLEEAAWQADRNGAEPSPLAVLHIGIDDLRGINNAFGQPAGDAVIAALGEQLTHLPSTVGHPAAAFAGGRFALLFRGDEPAAIALATHLCEALSRPFHSSGPGAHGPMAPTVSIGIACYPVHGAWSRLVRQAGAAMHHVQEAGGNGHALFNPAMVVDLREQALLVHDLRQAVQRGELRLLYQPKIDARSLQITAAEALLRWEHPVRGVVSPAAFIELAERHGLIAGIGEWVVAEACRQAAAWRELGLRMRIAINVSGRQLRHDDFVQTLLGHAEQHRIPPSRLTVEITETVAMEDTATTWAAFERLREAGFHVSIDDFGTGHSSLAVLRRLPAAEVKIDRQFVTDLETSASARSIVEAVLAVARTLSLRVVAEGVETTGQRDILVRLGCDELQGFLFARPMSAAALALWAEGEGPDGGGVPAGGVTAFRSSLFADTGASLVSS